MKNRTLKISAFGPFLVFTAILALVHGIHAQEKKPITVDLTEIRKGLAELQVRVSETTSSLDAVKQAARSQADLKGAYATFDGQFKKLESQLATLRAQATAMRARADDHHKAWQAELSKMGNPKLREKAMNRYADAKEEFDEIIVIAEEAKRELTPFVADLRDVATYLAADLSSDAVKSLNNTIWKLGNKSRSVVASIQHVSAQIAKALDAQPQGK